MMPQGGTSLDEKCYAMTATSDGRVILAGKTAGGWGEINEGGDDFVAVAVDMSVLATPLPTPGQFSPSLLETPSPSISSKVGGSSATNTLMIAGVVSAAAGVVLIAILMFLRERQKKNSTNDIKDSAYPRKTGDPEEGSGGQDRRTRSQLVSPAVVQPIRPPSYETLAAMDSDAPGRFAPIAGVATSRGPREGNGDGGAQNRRVDKTISIGGISTEKKGGAPPLHVGDSGGNAVALPTTSGPGDAAIGGSDSPRRSSAGGIGVARAVMEAAQELAQKSQIPGVCDAATLLAVLVNLVTDNMGNIEGVEWRIKRCRSILIMLERAARVLGKVRELLQDNLGKGTIASGRFRCDRTAFCPG